MSTFSAVAASLTPTLPAPERAALGASASLLQGQPQGSKSSPLPSFPATDTVSLGTSPADPTPAKKPWTLLYYAAGDDLLGKSQTQVLHDLEEMGSTSHLNIAAQLDMGKDGGATRRLITQGNAPEGTLASPVLEDLGQVDMTRPKSLSDFIRWGMEHFPAEHTMLVIGGVGGGWEGCVQDLGSHHFQRLPQLQKGLEDARYWTHQSLDVIGFDAAGMGMAEVAHQLQGDSKFMVSSQLDLGTMSTDYASMVTPDLVRSLEKRLAAGQEVTPRELATTAVETSKEQAEAIREMAALDLSSMPTLTQALRELSAAVVASKITDKGLEQLRDASQVTGYLGNQDLYDLCEQLKTDPDAEPALQTAADHCQQALGTLVVKEQHEGNHPKAHGLSIETLRGYERYQELTFPADSGWMAAQDRFNPAGSQAASVTDGRPAAQGHT